MQLKQLHIFFFIAAAAFAAGNALAVDTRLPNLGSSAGQVASPEEQRQYGFYVLHELRNQGGVVDDALLADYLNTLGYRLVSNSPQPDQLFTFFIVRDNDINAFALPGGFVGVNAGLVTTTENENELAAVLAHEISHITQNHLIRAVEAEQKMAPLVLLGTLAAVAASAHQSPYGSSDNAGGAIVAIQGLAAQLEINFTRQDELEADRVGIATLAKSGFDPDAMAGFFERMQRALRPGFDESDVPAMLMDHPVTTARISEAKARAEQIKKEYAVPAVSVGDVDSTGVTSSLPCSNGRACVGAADDTSAPAAAAAAGTKGGVDAEVPAKEQTVNIATAPLWISPGLAQGLVKPLESVAYRQAQHKAAQAYFLLMRERIRVYASSRPAEIITYYADNLKNHADFNTSYNRYGYALALTRGGRAKESLALLQKLITAEPENLVYEIALGNAELLSGSRDAALKRFVRVEKSFPKNRALALAHADALLQFGDKDAGRQAQDLLRPQLVKDDEDPDLQTTFARACELAGDPVRAGEAHATAAYLNGRAEDALNQLKDIAKKSDLNYYQRTRVEALIAQMTPLVLDLRRHKIRPEDQGKLTAACLNRGSPVTFSATTTAIGGAMNRDTTSLFGAPRSTFDGDQAAYENGGSDSACNTRSSSRNN